MWVKLPSLPPTAANPGLMQSARHKHDSAKSFRKVGASKHNDRSLEVRLLQSSAKGELWLVESTGRGEPLGLHSLFLLSKTGKTACDLHPLRIQS